MLYIMCMRFMLYKYTWNIYILYAVYYPVPGQLDIDGLMSWLVMGGSSQAFEAQEEKGAQCMVIGHGWENICFTNFFHFSRLHSQRKCRYLLKCSFMYYIRLLTSTNAGFFRMFRIFIKISKNKPAKHKSRYCQICSRNLLMRRVVPRTDPLVLSLWATDDNKKCSKVI